MQWSAFTCFELAEHIKNGCDAAILPVGATEQHGPHLCLGMDSQLGNALCEEVSKQTNVPMLPPLPYGCSLGHSEQWAGTIAVDPRTLIDLVFQIGDWAYRSGIRRLFIVNSHVTNYAPLRCALELLRSQKEGLMVNLTNTAEMSPRVKKAFSTDGEDWHANQGETAVMLSVSPEHVREKQIQNADDEDRTENCVFAHPVNATSENGVTGYPSRATKEQGDELFQWMIEDLITLINKGLVETPPLPAPYLKEQT